MLAATRRLGVVAALVLASIWVTAGPAAAITATSTSPANGASVKPPGSVRVFYDSPVNPAGSSITVKNKNGTAVGGTTSFANTLLPNDTMVFTPTFALSELGSPYSVYAFAVGVPTGTAETNFSFAVDETPPPAPTITELTDPVNADNQGAMRVAGAAESLSTVNVFVKDGTDETAVQVPASAGAYSADIDVTSLADGPLEVVVIAVDRAGNASGPGTDGSVKDTSVPTAPGVTITDDPINAGNQSAVTISGTSGEAGLTIDVSVDDDAAPSTPPVEGSATGNGSGAWTIDLNLTGLRQGEITATVTASDGAGNVSPEATDTAIKELGAPVLVEHSPADASVVAPPTTITATYNEALESVGSTIVVRDDTNDSVAGTKSFTDENATIVFTPTSPLTEAGGPYTVTVTAKDTAGNTASPATTFTFEVDSTAPAKPTITDTDPAVRPSNETTFAVAGEAETGSTVEVTVTDEADDSVSETTTANSPWDLTLDVSSLLDGTLTVTATATDEAGNTSPVSDAVEVFKFATERLFVTSFQDVRGTYIPVRGDYDGDGADDIFWYRAGSLSDALWLSEGGGSFTKTAPNVEGTYTPLVGDFDDDGDADIFWYRPGPGSDSLWFSDGDGTFTSVPQTVNGTFTPLVGDFDDDGFDDIFWYRPGELSDPVWFSLGDGSFFKDLFAVNGTYTPLVGDYDAFGGDDIFWYRPGAGADSLWYGFEGDFYSFDHTVNGVYTPILGDYDDNGTTDIFWYRPGTESDTVWLFEVEGPNREAITQTVNGFYTPIAGDYDGDGVVDIFWYRPGVMDDPVWISDGDGTFTSKTESVGGTYTPVPFDHDADSDTDIFWYRPGDLDDPLWLALG